MLAAIRWLGISVLILLYAGLEAFIIEGSSGMHSVHGRLILSALVLLTAGGSIIAVVAMTQRKLY